MEREGKRERGGERQRRREERGRGQSSICYQEKSYCVTGKPASRCDVGVMQTLDTEADGQKLNSKSSSMIILHVIGSLHITA